MKAIVISQPGGPEVLRIQERNVPQPADNEVLIKIYAAGINRPDVFQRKGNYPPPTWAPQDIPGLEVAGIIEQVGHHVTDWKKGDAVCALLAGGGYADFAVAQAGHCLPVPNGFNFVQAASLPETVFTVWHNVFQRGSLKSGENFLVHGGTSGIGITAIQLAKALGAKVFATAGSEEKCKACGALGAEICINYKTEDFEEKLKSEGADVILDMVGGDYIPKNIRLLREDGRLVFINTMKGGKLDGAEVDFGLIMKKRLTITGSTLRNRSNEFKTALAKEILTNVWPVIESGKFKTVIAAEFPLHEASKAHALMETSEHIGKIILVNDWES
ncbi:NAD(P)H-quinone oxidoreductase [Dyadobacter fanqingshengii]|uniref:NAD(P)H-quinone oxidoreductase n=1 Tax=Dyadobacter fanqingshengii TaxID=2906443 RepID=A0A9X1TA41_9BACT|nr:NAD(P)H-quinone oxidoreductase [Dyadobacter fanqingshengii]MCF0042095.1 NAD(P)H-quinone oxidoreductase [Dyadobacter fanqingshengii]USJ35369.1 NAD(P)H-quinone oxidoreductase [Dyadobacter fanqingshengii]